MMFHGRFIPHMLVHRVERRPFDRRRPIGESPGGAERLKRMFLRFESK
jgi:hypothetical protein